MVIMSVAIASAFLASTLLWDNLFSPELQERTNVVTALIAVATTLLIELLLSIPLVFYLGIHQSHRVVGPVKRIQRTLEAIGSGDFSQRITLRKGDLLGDVAQSINQMAEHLQRQFPKPPGT